MNERIQRLINESKRVVGHTDGGYTEIKAVDPERLVELVVKECANMIDATSGEQVFTDPAFNKGYFCGRGDAAAQIRDLFGV